MISIPLACLESDTAVAQITTSISLAGGSAGALYVTEVLVALVRLPAPREMLQVTPLFAGSFCTVAVKSCLPAAGTVALFGVMTTEIAGTVIAAELIPIESATETAVMVNACPPAGRLAGSAGAL
jgi:hypothetical protein